MLNNKQIMEIARQFVNPTKFYEREIYYKFARAIIAAHEASKVPVTNGENNG